MFMIGCLVPYAILQQDLTPPLVDQMERAFRVLPQLTAYDAITMTRDAYGILVQKLSLEDATLLQNAFATEGVPTEVVDEHRLIPLSSGFRLRQCECLPESLVIYDALGRRQFLEWPHVVLLAMGMVRMSRWKRLEKFIPGTMDTDGNYIPKTEVTNQEETLEIPILDIFVDVDPARYQIQGDQFLYRYLGERLQSDPIENYKLLARDALQYAPHAILNRGAKAFQTQSDSIFRYPTKHAFEEEIVWQLWRAMKPPQEGEASH